MKKLIICALCAICGFTTANAQGKFGHVNTQEIMQAMPEFAAAKADIGKSMQIIIITSRRLISLLFIFLSLATILIASITFSPKLLLTLEDGLVVGGTESLVFFGVGLSFC